MKRLGAFGWSLVFAIAVFAAATPLKVEAGGFQVTELCVKCQGNRNAGVAARADTASTVFFNPAGMAWMSGTQTEFGGHYIDGSFEFKNIDSVDSFGNPLSGTPSKDGAEPAFIPNFAITHEFSNRWSAGLSVNAPYGTVTKYDTEWVGRYHANKSDMLTIAINPAISYRFNEKWAIGGGIVYEYIDVTLSNNIDASTILNELGAGLPPPIQGLLPPPADPRFDLDAKVDGDDWAWGFNLGAIWEPLPGTRIGIGYRSEIDHELSGGALEVNASGPLQEIIDQLPPGLPIPGDGVFPVKVGGTADVTMPQTVWLGLTHAITEDWRVMAGGTWTEWSTFDEIVIELEDDGHIVQPENWSNSWRFGGGLEWDIRQDWTLRAGYEYDESPVPVKNNTARIPDEDRHWLALGFTWRPDWHGVEVDFAYTHIFINDYLISEKEVFTEQLAESVTGVEGDLGNVLNGSYDSNADVWSLGIRWSF